jgi:hypothetical protein
MTEADYTRFFQKVDTVGNFRYISVNELQKRIQNEPSFKPRAGPYSSGRVLFGCVIQESKN